MTTSNYGVGINTNESTISTTTAYASSIRVVKSQIGISLSSRAKGVSLNLRESVVPVTVVHNYTTLFFMDNTPVTFLDGGLLCQV